LAVLAAAIVPASFYELLFGPAFKDVKQSLVVLLPGVLFLSGYLIIGHYFSGTGKFYRNNLAISAGVIVTLIGFLFIQFVSKTEPDEITAAAITSIANFAIFFSVIWFFKADSGIHWKSLIPRWNDVQRFVKWFRPAA
jgi:O-antigen/teichoic acid export membrane protein